MKLGGYGCLRVATYLMPEAAQEYSLDHHCAGMPSLLLYGAFATMMQNDLKYINAYSSVSHCGFVLLGIGMLTQNGHQRRSDANGFTRFDDSSFLRRYRDDL